VRLPPLSVVQVPDEGFADDGPIGRLPGNPIKSLIASLHENRPATIFFRDTG